MNRVFAVSVLLLVSASAAGCGSEVAAAGPKEISLRTRQTIENVRAGVSYRLVFSYTNESGCAWTLQKASSKCSCIISPEVQFPLVVGAGATVDVPVRIEFDRPKWQNTTSLVIEGASSAGAVQLHATLTAFAPEEPYVSPSVLTMPGAGRDGTGAVEPMRVRFDVWVPKSSQAGLADCVTHATVEWDILDIRDAGRGRWSVYEVELRCHGRFPEGEVRAVLEGVRWPEPRVLAIPCVIERALRPPAPICRAVRLENGGYRVDLGPTDLTLEELQAPYVQVLPAPARLTAAREEHGHSVVYVGGGVPACLVIGDMSVLVVAP